MKKLILSSIFILSFIMLNKLTAQLGMLTSEENLIGESSEFLIGLHTGTFDCNQTVKFPFNIGTVLQFNYVPDVTKQWYFGAEVGALLVKSNEDALFRKTQLVLADFTIYPGFSFPIGAKITPDDNATLRLKKLSQARRFRIGLGFTATLPLHKRSSGHGVNLDAIKPGIGFSFRSSYDLPNRLSLFFNVTRIGKDLDGYAYRSSNSNERSTGNKHDVSYYAKLGVLWNFLKK